MNIIKKRNCIVCLKVFEYRTKGNKGKHFRIKNLRGKNMLTCSPKCSKIYNRIVKRIHGKENCKYLRYNQDEQRIY